MLVLLGVCVTAGTYWYSLTRSHAGAAAGFTLSGVEWGAMTETVSATGMCQPQEVIAVGSELSGRIVEIYPGADINQVVLEGAPLFQLENRLARINREQAKTAIG